MKSSLSCDESIPALEYLKRKHFVYGWFRGTDYLYIGITVRGKIRLETHNVINVVDNVLETDEFHFWYPIRSELFQLESWLINFWKPKYQTSRIRPHKGDYCLVCHCKIDEFQIICEACHVLS